jgi:hypothetical protein
MLKCGAYFGNNCGRKKRKKKNCGLVGNMC